MSQPPLMPLALVPLADRGTLPYEPLHGEPLYLHALRAVSEAVAQPPVLLPAAEDVAVVAATVAAAGLSARVLGVGEWWEVLRGPARPVVVHDPLCPLTPAEFLSETVARAAAGGPGGGVCVAAYRPVTDTVKTAVDGLIQGTIDREQLAAVLSPVVLAPAVLAGDERPPTADLADLVRWSRERGPVELVMAPAMARRVDDVSSVNLLECLDELGRRVRR